MKILVLTSKDRLEHFSDTSKLPEDITLIWSDYQMRVRELLKLGKDADGILVDAIGTVPAELIESMPNLKIIHSEGVGYEGIDVKAASKRGIYVCNNRGANAHAVAEQAVLLMLAVLKKLVLGDEMTRNGQQIDAKTSWIMEGIPELGSKKVGIIGLGAIGKQTAVLCKAFGCEVLYNNRHRLFTDEEEKLGVQYTRLNDLIKESDIISLHMPVTTETKGFLNMERIRQMKKTAIVINTARGEVVNNEDLAEALEKGIIAGAGLDTVAPEPVKLDNPLLNLSGDAAARITFSPHVGGVTTETFQKIYHTIWSNFIAVRDGKKPVNIVNE